MKDFSNYEYEKKLEEMTDLLRNAEGWGNGFDSTMGQSLIQMMVDVTDSLHYMLERRTAESFIETAKLRSSIIARACELGYRYRRSVANNGFVKIQPVDEDGNITNALSDIIIPQFTELSANGSTFFTVNQVTISGGQNEVQVQVRQGEVDTFVGELDGNGTLLIREYENIDNNVVHVSADGEMYMDVTRDTDNVNLRALSFLGPEDRYYDIKYATDGMRIIFGDNEFGKLPTGPVTVTFLRVNADDEPIIALEQEFEFDDAPRDINENEYEYHLENVTAIRGYLPPESDVSIKRNAVVYHKSNGRANTNDDYAYWVKNSGIPSIVDSRAFGEDELNTLVYNMNNVYITYLKEDGSDLIPAEEIQLRQFMDKLKTSQAHLVFNNARKLKIQAQILAKKNKSNPVANAEMYDIIYRYLTERLKLGEGSIGQSIYASDIVNELYQLTSTNNDVTRQLVEYVKVDLNGIVPFSVPMIGNKAYVTLSTEYTPIDEDKWVLILSNLICEVMIEETDTAQTMMEKMRDRVMAVTPYEARVVGLGLALDAFGNPTPIEIDPSVGETMLVGINTPYNSPDQIVAGAAVGSTLARVVQIDPSVTVNHFYYSSPAGRRPMIPLRANTVVRFTAPTDTRVLVYTRIQKDDINTEEFIHTIDAGEYYEFTSGNQHIIQFEYENVSEEDVIVEIEYPQFETTASFGLLVTSKDGFGAFELKTTSGDLASVTNVEYSFDLPVASRNFSDSTVTNIRPNSFSIIEPDGNLVLRDRGDGRFVNNIGILIPSGSINYRTGEAFLPVNFPVGEYSFKFDQNIYDNFTVDETTAIELILPKPNISSSDFSLSTIRID